MSATEKSTATTNRPQSSTRQRVPLLGFFVMSYVGEFFLRAVLAPSRISLEHYVDNPLPGVSSHECVWFIPTPGAVAICVGDDIAEIEYPAASDREEETF